MNRVEQSTPAASCDSVSLPAGAPGGVPDELTGWRSASRPLLLGPAHLETQARATAGSTPMEDQVNNLA